MQQSEFLDASVTAVPAGASFLDDSVAVSTEGLEKLWGPPQERQRAAQRAVAAAAETEDSGGTSVATAGAVVPLDVPSALLPGCVVDGQSLATDTLILLVAQRDPAENGLWLPGTPPVRPPATQRMRKGDWVFVCAGLTLAGTAFVCSNRRYNGVLEFRPVLARSALRDAAEERAFVGGLGVGAAYLNPPARPEDEHTNRTYLRFLSVNAAAQSRAVWFDFSGTDDRVAHGTGALEWVSRRLPLFEGTTMTFNSGSTVPGCEWDAVAPRGLRISDSNLRVAAPFPVYSVAGMFAFSSMNWCRVSISISSPAVRRRIILDNSQGLCYVEHASGLDVRLVIGRLVHPVTLYTLAWSVTHTDVRLVVIQGPPAGPRTQLQGQGKLTTAPTTTPEPYMAAASMIKLHEFGLFHNPPDDVTWNRMVAECDARCAGM
jgi:hypothetical protein